MTATELALLLCVIVALIVIAVLLVCWYLSSAKVNLLAFWKLQCHLPAQCMENTAIPKVIYRTAKTKSLSPAHQQAWDFTAKHNPDFEQVLLDDNDADAFMRTAMDGEAYAAYSSLVPGAAK